MQPYKVLNHIILSEARNLVYVTTLISLRHLTTVEMNQDRNSL